GDAAHGADDVDRGPVLGDEAGGAGGAGDVGRDDPGARNKQYPGAGADLVDLLADLGARLGPQQHVDQGDFGLDFAADLDRLGAGRGGEAALDPALALEQQAEAPLHDIVLVDHQAPQAPALGAHFSPTGTTRRTRQRSPSSDPNSTSPS